MQLFYVIKHIINVLYIVFYTISSIVIIVDNTISSRTILSKSAVNKPVDFRLTGYSTDGLYNITVNSCAFGR